MRQHERFFLTSLLTHPALPPAGHLPTKYNLPCTTKSFDVTLGVALSARYIMVTESNGPFVPALIVVDMQEDFCPPVSPAPSP